MNNYAIKHLFEFWEYIGSRGGFFTNEIGYKYCAPGHHSWPGKIFGLDNTTIDLNSVYLKIKNGTLPNSLGVEEDERIEKLLLAHNFEKKSVVKGMYLNVSNVSEPVGDFSAIQQVETASQATEFARVASESFGYTIDAETIISLIGSYNKIRLYISSHNGYVVNCGIIFLDQNNVSGIHMIGTIPEYRGQGLGKVMTTRLLSEACKNESDTVVLVASKAGERIYSKLGFKVDKSLASYVVNN